MALFAIIVGDKTTVIDAPSKSAANAYAHANVEIEIRVATLADLKNVDLSAVPSVVKGGKTEAQAAEAEAKKAAAAAPAAE